MTEDTTPRPTADICDAYEAQDGAISVLRPVFQNFGGRTRFSGRITTLRCADDNTKVRELLSQPGAGGVLVVDGGGSLRCALLGGNLAVLGAENNWSGVLVNGCVRDTPELKEVQIGIRALAAHPRRSEKRGGGSVDVVLEFADVRIVPGHVLTADEDGILLSPKPL